MKYKVTDEQKSFIKLYLSEGKTPEEIRLSELMKKENGTYHRLSTIKMWISRFQSTGSM